MSQATIKDVITVPRIAHGEAMQGAAAENARFAALLRSFEPGDWAKPTDCTLWDARAVAAHVVGSAAGQASSREFARQVRKGRPLIADIGGQYWWDGMNQLQIRERAGLSTGQLITEWDVASARPGQGYCNTLDQDPGHDGRIVSDLVAERAGTHGEPFTLSLDGPAGGQYRSGTAGEHVDMDAVEFCRIPSGRGEGTGILRHPLPL
jgi:hypothetical protein